MCLIRSGAAGFFKGNYIRKKTRETSKGGGKGKGRIKVRKGCEKCDRFAAAMSTSEKVCQSVGKPLKVPCFGPGARTAILMRTFQFLFIGGCMGRRPMGPCCVTGEGTDRDHEIYGKCIFGLNLEPGLAFRAIGTTGSEHSARRVERATARARRVLHAMVGLPSRQR